MNTAKTSTFLLIKLLAVSGPSVLYMVKITVKDISFTYFYMSEVNILISIKKGFPMKGIYWMGGFLPSKMSPCFIIK